MYTEIRKLMEKNEFKQALDKLLNMNLQDWEGKFLLMRVYNNLDDFRDERLEFGIKTYEMLEDQQDEAKIAILTELLTIFYRTGKERNSLEYISHANMLVEGMDREQQDIETRVLVADLLNNIAIIYSNLGQRREALEKMQLRIDWLEGTGRKQDEAVSYSNIGYIYNNIGEIKTSLEYQLKALDLTKDNGSKRQIAIYSNNIGNNYGLLGELELSEKFLNNAIKLTEEIEMDHLRAYSLAGLAITLFKQNKLEMAMETLEIADTVRRQFDDLNLSCNLLFAKIEIAMFNKKVDLAKSCLQELEELIKEEPEKSRHKEYYEIGKALILKESNIFREKIKAEDTFRDYLRREDTKINKLKWKSFLYLSALLLEQIDVNSQKETIEVHEEEIIEELQSILEKLREETFFEDTIELKIQSLVLEAYLQLAKFQTDQAMELFEEAAMYCQKSGIKTIILDLPEEQKVEFNHDYSSFSPEVLQSLDSIIHSVPRLKIIVLLNHFTKLSFIELQKKTGLTAGNLGRHCNKLVSVGYVFKNKEVIDDKFLTIYEMTPEGLLKFSKYCDLLLPFISL